MRASRARPTRAAQNGERKGWPVPPLGAAACKPTGLHLQRDRKERSNFGDGCLTSRAGHMATLRQPDARKQAAGDSVDAVERGHDISFAVDPGHCQEHDMNASPNIDPVTERSDSDVVHWLTNGTRDERFIDNIFAELCV